MHDQPALDPFSLKGKVSLITGGARGLGLAMAEGLARAGSDVILVSRSQDQLEEAARQIRLKAKVNVMTLAADVSGLEALPGWLMQIEREIGPVDVLVNNAGGQVRKPFIDFTPADFDKVISVNLRAVFFLTQSLVKRMISLGRAGSIINVASLTSKLGIANTSAYGASKGGIASLTKNMAVELAPYGIRANAVAPGYFRTTLTEDAFQDEDRRQWIESRIPLGAPGAPRDLAGMVVFLASPASGYVTGTVTFIDGGWTAA